MKKKDREIIFNKYGGKCAYCGCELQKGWNADHIEAHWHTLTHEKAEKVGIKKGSNDIENFNPSCPRCNKWKATFSIDEFRREIQLQIQRLNAYNPNYRLAKDYGLLSETPRPVKFYFETIQNTEK